MTMAQVAKLAGVSQATVSRVVNKDGNVAAPTVRAVERAMAELGYRGRRRKRAAAGDRDTLTLAVLMVDRSALEHPGMAMAKLLGVQAAAAEAGVRLLFAEADDEGRHLSETIGLAELTRPG